LVLGMPVAFLDLAQTCAPIVAPETLAGIVSLESRFAPFNIRINSGRPLKTQPISKYEAIEIATSLAAEHHDIQLGLGGIGVEELQKLKLSISDAFDPCLNLRAAATLLDGYYRLAVKGGADPARAEQVMLQSYYGRDDPSVGAMANYDDQVRHEINRLGPTIARLTITDTGEGRGTGDTVTSAVVDVAAGFVAENSEQEITSIAPAPSWDVFNSRRQSSVMVYQNNRMEQSE
jgi:type IV secretion system protein VirB1